MNDNTASSASSSTESKDEVAATNKRDSERLDECLGKSLDQLSNAFMSSAKRWETIVYPSLFVFMILAGSGFYLIYSLTNDASRIAGDMNRTTLSMEKIVVNMETMSKNMVVMTQVIDSQSVSMKEMTYHMRGMSVSMSQMRYDFSVLNNSVAKPMSFMNTFMPW